MSPVSSTPFRVCLCGSNGRPQCANLSQIFTSVNIYRGETFALSAYVVGYDFGTTVGTIYTNFLSDSSNLLTRLGQNQDNQLVNSSETCSTLNYTVYTEHSEEQLRLSTSILPINIDYTKSHDQYKVTIHDLTSMYNSHKFGCIGNDLLTTPVFINITLLPGCPPGLTLKGNPPGCSCYSVLTNNGFHCFMYNKAGYLTWNTKMWVNATFNMTQSNGIIYNPFCPLQYCRLGDKTINIKDDPNKQCASNRTGVLCGACKNNFSLAIGSSQCIECSNSNNLALVLFFAVGGVFLVFFILMLNLTVTQGLINGVIFYANIVWAYEIILFPSRAQESSVFPFLRVFISWLNLDFGIETCLFVGLNAYWKTWLRFIFPCYIWAIAGCIIVACHHSSRLTHIIGSRAVPLLATLFLLSCMKLLRIIIDTTAVAMITQYPLEISYSVWYHDGNLLYCKPPHIYLFLAAIAVLVFLWLPYTLVLLFIQLLRRVSHLRPLAWINKLTPVYDAYFFPLKDQHQYWFGILLLIRGILLVVLTVTSTTSPRLNVFILSVTMSALLFFTSVKLVYKRVNVRILESCTFLNLLVLSSGTLYMWESETSRTTLLEISIWFSFTQFCVIFLESLIRPCCNASRRYRHRQGYEVVHKENSHHIIEKRIEDPEIEPVTIFTGNTVETVTY